MGDTTPRRLSDATREELEALCRDIGQPAFRARQIHDWMHKQGVFATSEMSNLPKTLRAALDERYPAPPIAVARGQAADDGTEKLLFTLSDGQRVESVFIPTPKRTTICLSSQVGCAVRCDFCASGLEGGKRNLSRGEIFEQYMAMRTLAAEHDRGVTNLVMMGMGEPMFNYDNVFAALGDINAEDGPNLGARRITVSTIGIEKGVRRFTEAKTQYTLAFSLHAPNDEIRRRIVPLRSAMPVAAIRDWAMRYLEHTGREVTFEYVMLDGINSDRTHARELARLMRGIRATVNLIPYNPVEGLPYGRPSDPAIDAFRDELVKSGAKVSLRRRRGADIDAACGQLALKAAR